MHSLKYRTLRRQAKTLLSQAARKIVDMRTDSGYVKVEIEAIVWFPYGDGGYWAQTIKVHRMPKRLGKPRGDGAYWAEQAKVNGR